MADWDAEDFEPTDVDAANAPVSVTDRWDGEDADDEIKDCWEEEEEKGKESGATTAVQVPKKKSLSQRLAEKEANRKQVTEEKKKQIVEANREITQEELAAEKFERQKAQEEADLQLAKEAFGASMNNNVDGKTSIDALHPVSKEDFENFAKQLTEKITTFEKSGHYVNFLEMLYRDLVLGLEAEDVKRLGSTLNAVANEKTKAQKPKAKKKGKSKATVYVDKEEDNAYGDTGFDLYDDFI